MYTTELCGVARDKREERDSRDVRDARRAGKTGLARRGKVRGPKFEVSGTSNPDLQPSTFGPRQSRPSRLSQASTIAAEVFMNSVG